MASDPVVARREMEGLLRGGRLTSFDPGWFEYGGRTLSPESILTILAPHLSAARLERIDAVLDDRTYNLAIVVDGMVDTGNVSAVMRTPAMTEKATKLRPTTSHSCAKPCEPSPS